MDIIIYCKTLLGGVILKRMLLLLLIVLSFPVLCMGESAIQSEGNMSYIITIAILKIPVNNHQQ